MDLTLQDEAQVGDQVGMSMATEGQGLFDIQNQITVDISDFIDCSLSFIFLFFFRFFGFGINIV